MKRGTKIAGLVLAVGVVLGGAGVVGYTATRSAQSAEKTALTGLADDYTAAWETLKDDAENGWSKEDLEKVKRELEAEERADRIARGLPAEPTPEETAYNDAMDSWGPLTQAMLDAVQAGCAYDGGDWDVRLHGTNYGWCTADAAGRGVDVALTHTRDACSYVRGTWTQSDDTFPDLKSAHDAVVIVGPSDAKQPVTGTCVMVYGKVGS